MQTIILILQYVHVFCNLVTSVYMLCFHCFAVQPEETDADRAMTQKMKETFDRLAGVDQEIDAYELESILNAACKSGKNTKHFPSDVLVVLRPMYIKPIQLTILRRVLDSLTIFFSKIE